MQELFSHQIVIAFVVVWLIEFYLFGLQRATLLIIRTNNADYSKYSSLMLPEWYFITWIFRIGKYILLLFIAINNWKLGIGLFVGQFIASVIIPIPYKFFYTRILLNRAKRRALTCQPYNIDISMMLKIAGYEKKNKKYNTTV